MGRITRVRAFTPKFSDGTFGPWYLVAGDSVPSRACLLCGDPMGEVSRFYRLSGGSGDAADAVAHEGCGAVAHQFLGIDIIG